MIKPESTVPVSLSLDGQTQEIDALAVASAIENLVKLVSGFDSASGKVKLAELREGSAVAGVLVAPETRAELIQGVQEIRHRRRIPHNWSYRQMKRLQRITSLSEGTGATSVSMLSGNERLAMDAELRASIEAALSSVVKSIGSVVGELYRYTEKKSGFEAGMRSELTGTAISLQFGEDLEAQVRELLRSRVEVRGILHRHPETNSVERIEVKGIEGVPRPLGAVSGYGIWNHFDFEGKSGEQIVRELRDSEE